MKTINLDRCGLLFGLSGLNYDTVKSYMQSIDYDRPKNEIVIQCIAPVVRRTLCRILETEHQMYRLKSNPEMVDKVMAEFNVNEISDELDVIYSELVPVMEKYLSLIDVQAEITVLFCDNYVHYLMKKVLEGTA